MWTTRWKVWKTLVEWSLPLFQGQLLSSPVPLHKGCRNWMGSRKIFGTPCKMSRQKMQERRRPVQARRRRGALHLARGAFGAGGPVCRPYGGKRSGSVGSTEPGAGVELYRPQFSTQIGRRRRPPTQSPAKRVCVGEEERWSERALSVRTKRGIRNPRRRCAPEILHPVKGMTPVMGVLGGGDHRG